jgi:hypothetical protein
MVFHRARVYFSDEAAMDIKISPSNQPTGQIDEPNAVEDTHAVAETEATTNVASANLSADAVAQVTVELRTGILSPDRAVERLVSLTLRDPAVAGAPSRVKSEMAEVLRVMLETDPRLTALLVRLGIRVSDEK